MAETDADLLYKGEKSIVLPRFDPGSKGDFQELDEQIKSMMGKGQTTLPNGRTKRICNVCGKEGDYRVIKDHIEANHIEGVSVPCNNCERIFRSRPSLQMHILRNHK